MQALSDQSKPDVAAIGLLPIRDDTASTTWPVFGVDRGDHCWFPAILELRNGQI